MTFTPIRVAKLAAVCIVAVSQLLVVGAIRNYLNNVEREKIEFENTETPMSKEKTLKLQTANHGNFENQNARTESIFFVSNRNSLVHQTADDKRRLVWHLKPNRCGYKTIRKIFLHPHIVEIAHESL